MLLADKLEKVEITRPRRHSSSSSPRRAGSATPPAQAVRGLGVGAARRARPRAPSASSRRPPLARRPSSTDAAALTGCSRTSDADEPARDAASSTTTPTRLRRQGRRDARLASRTTHRLRAGAVRRPTSTASCVSVHAQLGRARRHAAVLGHAAASDAGEALLVRGAARRGPRPSRGKGVKLPALQGPRRDEPRAAPRDDDGPRRPARCAQVTMEDAAAADRHLHDADGRQGRAPPRVHRGQRPRRRQPGRLAIGRRATHRSGAASIEPRAARGRDARRLHRLRDVA